jgi:hypothetical protein
VTVAACRRLADVEEMLRHLTTILLWKDDEDADDDVAADWRNVAAFADRCLFWVFLVVTAAYTGVTMVLVPFFMQ